MVLVKGEVLLVVKPVYGTPGAPMHWLKIFMDYHKQNLDMTQADWIRISYHIRKNGRWGVLLNFTLMKQLALKRQSS